MNRDEIREALKEQEIKEPDLEDLTALLHKYCNPDEYSKITSARINDTSNDYLALVKHMYREYRNRNKTPSIPSIKQKISYLSKYDIELTEDYIEELFAPDGIVEQKALDKGYDGNSYTNFRYHSYLAIRTYLKAKDVPELAAKLPHTEEIGKPDTNPRTEYLKEKEIEQLLEATDDTDTELIIMLGFYCGMRIQEILQLQTSWIHFLPDEDDRYGYITLPKWVTKTNDDQRVYFNQRLSELLKAKLEEIDELNIENKGSVIILNLLDDETLTERKPEMKIEDERQEAIERLQEVVDRLAVEDNIEDKQTIDNLQEFKHGDKTLTPHILRHSFLRHVESLSDVKTARDQARHKSIDTTMTYLEKAEEEKKEDYKKVF